MNTLLQGGAAWLARWTHNPKVAGSNPAPATTPSGGAFSNFPSDTLGLSQGTAKGASGDWHCLARFLFLPVRPTAKFMASEIPAPISVVIVGALASLFVRPMNRRGRRLHRWLALSQSVRRVA